MGDICRKSVAGRGARVCREAWEAETTCGWQWPTKIGKVVN